MKKWIGIDLSKAKLDLSDGQNTWVMNNTPKALDAFCRTLDAHTHLLCEASGGYEKQLLSAAHGANISISLLHASRIRHFRLATGKSARNDQIDAEVIRQYGKAVKPSATPEPDANQLKLNALFTARTALDSDLNQAGNRLEKATDQDVRRLFKSQITFLKNKITTLDEKIQRLLKLKAFASKAEALRAIKGIGPQSTAALLGMLPELGTLSRQHVASLVGVAPMDCESGKWKGQRKIQGGRAALRRVLYMAAIVASRHNTVLKSVYQRLTQRGKPPKVALVAIMRKLLIHCNTVIKPLVNQPA